MKPTACEKCGCVAFEHMGEGFACVRCKTYYKQPTDVLREFFTEGRPIETLSFQSDGEVVLLDAGNMDRFNIAHAREPMTHIDYIIVDDPYEKRNKMERKPRGVHTRIFASQSFTEEEVQVLDSIFAILRRGGDAKVIARSTSGQSVLKKVQAMKNSVARQQAERAAGKPLPKTIAEVVAAAEASMKTDGEELPPSLQNASEVFERLGLDKLCTCQTQGACYEGNPCGHIVGCPRWGSQLPNECLKNSAQAPAHDPLDFSQPCCANEMRSMEGGCLNCGAPCL